eukprot:jgi/Ulvmu1/6390/UM003_0018.1
MAGNEDDLEKLFMDEAAPAQPPSLGDPTAPAGATGEPTLSDPAADRSASAPAPRAMSSLPLRQQMALDAAAGLNNAVGGSGGMKYEPSTVLESDWASLNRELAGIWCNIKLVCTPFLKQDDVTAMLQHWDLWGPLIFNLMLACLLSLESADPERTFSVVFIVVIAGALLLTVNVVLLGGSVSLLQSVSLLGYCVFPLDLAAIGCFLARRNRYAEIVMISLSVLWAMYASVPFLAGTVGEHRRWLAVYPIALMFAILGWLIFIS